MNKLMNYKEQAEKKIEAVHEWMGDEGITEATMIAEAILAQTYATLELANQQRIANTIAYSVAEMSEGSKDKIFLS